MSSLRHLLRSKVLTTTSYHALCSRKAIIYRRWHSASAPTVPSGSTDEDEWSNFDYGSFLNGRAVSKRGAKRWSPAHQFQSALEASAPPSVDPLWIELTDQDVQTAIQALTPSVTEQRMARFKGALKHRTNAVRFVFENPANVNNCWAALRTFDAMGLQYTDIILGDAYADAKRRKEMSTSMGCQKYMSLTQHWDTESCIQSLRKQNYTVAVADLHHPTSVPFSQLDFHVDTAPAEGEEEGAPGAVPTSSASKRMAIVLGNEVVGASATAREMADIHFYLPMRGFAESLNVSAFAALLCGKLESSGVLGPRNRNGRIPGPEQQRILLTWLARTAPGAMHILKRAGLQISSPRIWDKIGNYTTKP